MQTIEHLRELFDYNHWSNLRIADCLAECDAPRARQIFDHLVINEQEYLERLPGRNSTGFNFWPDISIDECRSLAEKNSSRFLQILDSDNEDILDRRATYSTSEGVKHTNTWRELFSHVLIHSATHRGNIMLKLRESGIAPPATDYIIYLREKCAKI